MPRKSKNELAKTTKSTEIQTVNRWISSELLETRRKELGIPEFRTKPIDDNVVVWRLPPLKMSPGGIIIPEEAQTENLRGIVIGIGPLAQKWADQNGMQLGECVIFKRFAGWEHQYGVDSGGHTPMAQFDRRALEIVHLKPKDILCSDDLFANIEKGDVRFAKNERGDLDIEVRATPAQTKEHKEARRRRKVANLAKGTDNQHEAATAARILNGGAK